MAKEPRTGELTTANYGWTKPTVGASDDAWGGYLNADLDGIDSTVHGVSTIANAAYPASNPAGYVTAAAIPAPYILPTASTTVLGGVKVDGSTVTAAGDGTLTAHATGGVPEAPTDGKLYSRQNSAWTPTVVPLGDNRIINGDCRIDQRNNGASGTGVGVYTIDRWIYTGSQNSKFAWQRAGGGAPMAGGFPYWLTFTSTSAFALATADYFQLQQMLEADMVSDFAWGTVSAQPVTLSFWAYSGLTGTFSGSIRNYATTRSYPFTYSIPVASTWTRIVITIPGDTAGTWVMAGNGGAINLSFDLGTGSTYRGPANAWATANYVGATGAVSVVAVNAATFYLTGVKLEVGSVATPYNRQSLAKSMADCQRYYQPVYATCRLNSVGPAFVSNNMSWFNMRSSPTCTLVTAGTRAANVNTISVTASGANSGALNFQTTATAGTDSYILGDLWSLAAEL